MRKREARKTRKSIMRDSMRVMIRDYVVRHRHTKRIAKALAVFWYGSNL